MRDTHRHEPPQGYRIRQSEPETQFNELLSIETITRVVPLETIHEVLQACGVSGQRQRRLPGWLTVRFCMGMNLLSELSMKGVMEEMMRGARLLAEDDERAAPSAGAYRQARACLGAKAMERLVKSVGRPLANQVSRPLMRNELPLVTLACVRDNRGAVAGFAGVAEHKVEMLFIHPTWRGQGAGRRLLSHAVEALGATTLDVNEQNE